jgi:nucleoid DNA-binding protein
MPISKKKLAAIIHERLNGTITKAAIYDAMCVICDDMFEKLINGEMISVSNFGTLDTYTYHGHDGVDISTGEVRYVAPFISVKFVPHNNFRFLLNNKKDEFRY